MRDMILFIWILVSIINILFFEFGPIGGRPNFKERIVGYLLCVIAAPIMFVVCSLANMIEWTIED